MTKPLNIEGKNAAIPSVYQYLKIDSEACTGCGLCIKQCPVLLLEMRNKKAVIVEGREHTCLKCGHCGSVCPVGAISSGATEIATQPKFEAVTPPSPEALQLLLRSRRSVRNYKQKPVEREMLEKILQAGRFAPTGSNMQNVNYIVITSSEEIVKLTSMTLKTMKMAFSVSANPFVFPFTKLFVGDTVAKVIQNYTPVMKQFGEKLKQGEDRLFHHAPALMIVHGEKRDEAGAFNCAVALYNCSLMAHSLGVGCCFNGFLQMAINNNPKVRRQVGIPGNHKCYGAMTMGYQQVKFNLLVKRNEPRVVWK